MTLYKDARLFLTYPFTLARTQHRAHRVALTTAIGICFSMTTVFRSDVLATSLSRITDLPTLPLVFLRTTIQAVSTYKSLIPFIANNILPKLVTKKVWEQPPLWDGFTRLVKMIAPHSFGCVLQLPREEMKDLVKRQPALRTGLRGFLEGKGMGQADLDQVSLARDLVLALGKRKKGTSRRS
jgi:symplekin